MTRVGSTSRALLTAMAIALLPGGIVRAAETITYKYDAKGRLIEVSRTGTVNDNVKTTYTHDKANNRKAATTTGSGNTPPPTPPPPVSAPTFSISDADNFEGNFATFTVTKTGSATASFTVNFATATGTATASDFTAASGTLTFAASETVKNIGVVLKTDSLLETDEIFYVNLSLPSGGSSITDSQGSGTVFDTEPLCNGLPC